MKAALLSRRIYQWIRGGHLYLGIFICPFILVYAVSTLLLNHSIRPTPEQSDTEIIPLDLSENLQGEALVKSVLGQLSISGEVAGRGQIRNQKTTIRVQRPGRVKIITVDLEQQQASVIERSTGILGALNFLHFNPGLHRTPNWIITKFWGWIADAVVYLTLFLTLSGIYLWALIKSERKRGWIALGAGALTFTLLVAALFYS